MTAKIIPFPPRLITRLNAGDLKHLFLPSSMDELPLISDERIEKFHRELNRMLGIIPPMEARADEVTSPKTPRGA